MSRIQRFTEFEAFKKCRVFVREVGLLLKRPVASQDLELQHQARRAMISVLANFGEGFEREGSKELIQFLSSTKGSIGELRGQLIYGVDQSYFPPETQERVDLLGEEASKLVGGLMKYLASHQQRHGRKFAHED